MWRTVLCIKVNFNIMSRMLLSKSNNTTHYAEKHSSSTAICEFTVPTLREKKDADYDMTQWKLAVPRY